MMQQRVLKTVNVAINAMRIRFPFNPVSVGSGINTSDDEYWPSITADGFQGQLMLTRNKPNIF